VCSDAWTLLEAGATDNGIKLANDGNLLEEPEAVPPADGRREKTS